MSDVDRGLVWGLAVPNSVHPVCVCWIPRVADGGGQTKDLKLVPEVRGPNGIVEGGRWTRAATNDGTCRKSPSPTKALPPKGRSLSIICWRSSSTHSHTTFLTMGI